MAPDSHTLMVDNAKLDTTNQSLHGQINQKNTRSHFEQHVYDDQMLNRVRADFEKALTEEFRSKQPLDWATTQNHLGIILATLGESEKNPDLIQHAIEALTYALEERQQENTPNDWATSLDNLGMALQMQGQQNNDSKLLNKSIDAYTDALLVWTRNKTPFEWSSTMINLGMTFHAYGKLLKGNRTFQKSVVAFKNALAELDADNQPLELAVTHNNRGAVLQHLGESENNPDRLHEALRSYEAAITIFQEQQQPVHLVVLAKANLNTTRINLALLTKDKLVAEEAADDLELIVELFENACHPDCLEHCKNQMAKARAML